MEIWREIKGYEGIYEVSNLGRIRSLDRYVNHSRSGKRIVRGSIKKLQPPNPKTGYIFVSLYKDGKFKTVSVHRLVAFAFPEICGEPFEGCQVDHLDTVRHNNVAANLRLCTASENHLNPITYERAKENCRKSILARKGKPAWNKGLLMPEKTGAGHWHSIPILQKDLNGNVIKKWTNTREAAKSLGTVSSSIYNCLTNRSKTACGFRWEYA